MSIIVEKCPYFHNMKEMLPRKNKVSLLEMCPHLLRVSLESGSNVELNLYGIDLFPQFSGVSVGV